MVVFFEFVNSILILIVFTFSSFVTFSFLNCNNFFIFILLLYIYNLVIHLERTNVILSNSTPTRLTLSCTFLSPMRLLCWKLVLLCLIKYFPIIVLMSTIFYFDFKILSRNCPRIVLLIRYFWICYLVFFIITVQAARFDIIHITEKLLSDLTELKAKNLTSCILILHKIFLDFLSR